MGLSFSCPFTDKCESARGLAKILIGICAWPPIEALCLISGKRGGMLFWSPPPLQNNWIWWIFSWFSIYIRWIHLLSQENRHSCRLGQLQAYFDCFKRANSCAAYSIPLLCFSIPSPFAAGHLIHRIFSCFSTCLLYPVKGTDPFLDCFLTFTVS